MIKNLFTKRDHRLVPGITKEQAMQAASWYWRSRQFGVSFTSPFSMSGGQFYSRLGLRQSIYVYAVDEGSSVAVDISLSAELTDEGAAVGIVGAVLLFPVAVAVGAVSYLEYENEATRLLNDFWVYMNTFPKNPQPPPPAPLPPWAQGQTAQPVSGTVPTPAPSTGPTASQMKTCPACGMSVDSDSKFCKSCGTKL
jgi:hypothetical protein